MATTLDTVFLSSTAKDLTAFRDAVWLRLTRTGVFHCRRMENFGPQDETAIEHCRSGVCSADIFVGIIGHRRGWEPFAGHSNDPRSITEMEHDWAREARVRRYLWVAPESFPVPGNLRESDTEHARQTAFRTRIRDGNQQIISHDGFGTPELLASEIVEHLLKHKLAQAMVSQAKPAEGRGIETSRAETEAGVAAAIDAAVALGGVDLLALAQDPSKARPADFEDKLRAHAEAMEAQARPLVEQGRKGLAESAEAWRHIGALAFLHDTGKALAAYEKAVALDPDNADGLRFLGELDYRRGDLTAAEKTFERLLDVGLRTGDRKAEAMACMRLGWVLRTRGNLAGDEEMQTDALRISEAIDWKEGVARAADNLGVIHQTRGEFDRAEEMLLEALALNEELGSKEGMAASYGNLGNNHLTRGDLDRAEEMHLKSLALEEDLGRRDGMSDSYISLGIIHQTRGDLARAEEMLRKALALNEELGRKEGMAIAYGNLGLIHQTRGDLGRSEAMLLKSLALNEEFGSKEGMAITCCNLARIRQQRGDIPGACTHFRRARDLYREMGLAKDAAAADAWLRDLGCPE